MAIEVFNRYEHKYMLDREMYRQIVKIIEQHMEIDSHNENHKPYTIANIYYDTPDNYLIRTSLSKPEYKEKLRLRAYGIPSQESKVFLEIKKKFRGVVNKRRTKLKLAEAYNFIETKTPPKEQDYMNKQVVREIDYFIHLYNLSPKLYLAYDRIAYYEKGNPDLRISFDTNIRSRRYDLRLDAGDYGKPLLPGEYYLMEIKTSLAKPIWLADILNDLNIKRQSFSKYGSEFKNMMHSIA